MLDSMFRHLRPAGVWSVPHLTRWVGDLTVVRDRIAARNAGSAIHTSLFSRRLEHLLSQIDFDWLCDLPLQERYVKGIMEQRDGLMDILTSSQSKALILRDGLFHQMRKPAAELVVPTWPVDPITRYPKDETWDQWRNIRPLRIIASDADVLSFNIVQNRITYPEPAQSFVVIAVDIVALALQASVWKNAFRTHSGDMSDPNGWRDYLQNWVIGPTLLTDVQSSWLIQFYAKAIQAMATGQTYDREAFIGQIYDRQKLSWFGASFSRALDDLDIAIGLVKKAALSPARLFCSLPTGDGSVSSVWKDWRDASAITPLQHLWWTILLRDLPYLELLVDTFRLSPRVPDVITSVRQTRRDARMFIDARIWSTVPDIKTRLMVQQRLETFYDTLKTWE